MSQLAIYLDAATSRRLDEAARRDGVSRSAWVREAVQARLHNRLPDSFFDTFGSWEDDREPEEILREIRVGPPAREREPFE